MEFYIIENLIVRFPVYNARENVTQCQLSVIVSFLRNNFSKKGKTKTKFKLVKQGKQLSIKYTTLTTFY